MSLSLLSLSPPLFLSLSLSLSLSKIDTKPIVEVVLHTNQGLSRIGRKKILKAGWGRGRLLSLFFSGNLVLDLVTNYR